MRANRGHTFLPVNNQSDRIATLLAEQVEQGADGAQIANTIVSAWIAVDAALAPIVGQPTVAVLYMRSRHLTSRAFPWLRPEQQARIEMDLPALRSLLLQQDPASAAAGGGALLRTFYELLASLIGPSLTGRLLGAMWNSSSSGEAAQDNPA